MNYLERYDYAEAINRKLAGQRFLDPQKRERYIIKCAFYDQEEKLNVARTFPSGKIDTIPLSEIMHHEHLSI